MRYVTSKQVGVPFVFCPSPVTIDKRAAWGPMADNLQEAPNGAFMKMNKVSGKVDEVSHLVQPNVDKSAPVGWMAGAEVGLFDKLPIWVDEKVLQPGTKKEVNGLDGVMTYEVQEPSVVTYNGDESGPDLTDDWVQTVKNVQKNYNF